MHLQRGVLTCFFIHADMVGDSDRGVILEMLLSKLSFCGDDSIQVLGMGYLY